MFEKLMKKVERKEGEPKLSFWFVRHAESEGNTLDKDAPLMQDTPLTERGIKEAEDIAKYLQKNAIRVTHIYTSSKGRSHQTAEIIASEMGVPVNVKNGLDERNWGDWKDLKWDEASQRLDKMPMDERYTFVPEGGESWEQMEGRLFNTLEEIADESKGGENVLIVTHKGCLRAIMPKLAQAGIEQHKEYSVSTGALSKFSFEKEKFDFVGLVPEK